QEGLAGHGFGFVGDGGTVGGVVAGPLNEALLDAPDYSPDVEQHDPADAAANAEGKQQAALPAAAVPAQEEPGCDRDDDPIDHADECTFVEDSLARDEAGVEDAPNDRPDQKEAAHDGSHPTAA